MLIFYRDDVPRLAACSGEGGELPYKPSSGEARAVCLAFITTEICTGEPLLPCVP